MLECQRALGFALDVAVSSWEKPLKRVGAGKEVGVKKDKFKRPPKFLREGKVGAWWPA